MPPLRSRRQGDGPALPITATDGGEDAFRQALRRELERGRRYCRPFALVRVPLAPPARSRSILSRRRRPTMAQDLLRSTDTAWMADGALYLLLPESDRASAEQFVHRLATAVDLSTSEAVTVVFPDDGVTIAALLEALTRGPGAVPLGQWAGTWQDRSNGSGRSAGAGRSEVS